MSRTFQNIVPRDPHVRPLPYPYVGALSIANDAEFFHFDAFQLLMKYVNSSLPTPLGHGLGLELTSSLFFFSNSEHDLTYFNGTSPTSPPSRYANRINEYLTSGWIDTIHAYGNFSGIGGFVREHAIKCYEILNRLNVRLSVFTNHGGAENIQNVGTDADYHYGDRAGHAAYHTDLMQMHGVDFVWTDSMLFQKPQRDGHSLWENASPRHAHTCKPPSVPSAIQRVLSDCVLQDNSQFKGFNRFRSTGANAPNLSSLGSQLRQIDWCDLYSSNGAIIIYQHLGVLCRSAGVCIPVTLESLLERPEVFLSPFNFLAVEKWEGRLWVCGLSRLLQYVAMVETTRIAQVAPDRYMIITDNDKITDPQLFFQGLTLYIDTSKPFKLYYGNTPIKLLNNGPDETGYYSVTVPIQKLQQIW